MVHMDLINKLCNEYNEKKNKIKDTFRSNSLKQKKV